MTIHCVNSRERNVDGPLPSANLVSFSEKKQGMNVFKTKGITKNGRIKINSAGQH